MIKSWHNITKNSRKRERSNYIFSLKQIKKKHLHPNARSHEYQTEALPLRYNSNMRGSTIINYSHQATLNRI